MSPPQSSERDPSAASAEAPTCDSPLVDLNGVRQVQPETLSAQRAQQMAEFFRVLANPSRLRLLSALAQRELCVCDLAAITKMSESAVSHQLRTLRAMRLVNYRRQGRNVYYHLADGHVIELYRAVDEHLDELPH